MVKKELSEEDLRSISDFEAKLSDSIINEDDSFLKDKLNVDELLKIATKGIDFKNKEKKTFLAGVKRGLAQSKAQLINLFVTSDLTYIRLVHETRPALLYRIIMPDSSFTYGEFHLAKMPADGWEIVDLHLYSNGVTTSTMLRESMSHVVGGTTQNKKMQVAIQKASKLGEKSRAGDFKTAWEGWKKIDPLAHKNRSVVMAGYVAAFGLYMNDTENDEPLKEIVSLMVKHFSDDAGFSILELGIHEINKDYKKYREAIGRIRQRVGEDQYLDLLESAVDLDNGDYDKVVETALAFKKSEPYSTDAYGMLWLAYTGKKDYVSMTKSLNEFEGVFGIHKSQIRDDPDFKAYCESPEGKAWLAVPEK